MVDINTMICKPTDITGRHLKKQKIVTVFVMMLVYPQGHLGISRKIDWLGSPTPFWFRDTLW